MRKRHRTKIILFILLVLTIVILSGPRVVIDETIKPLTLPSDLDSYLLRSESKYTDIKQGTEKKICCLYYYYSEQKKEIKGNENRT